MKVTGGLVISIAIQTTLTAISAPLPIIVKLHCRSVKYILRTAMKIKCFNAQLNNGIVGVV